MIPAAFEYRRATSLEEALRLLQEAGSEAKLLAGGHSLLPLMKLRLAQPAVLVDIGGLEELRGIRLEGEELVIGALTPHAEVAASAQVAEAFPLLARAAAAIGDLQVRNRGTVGGNLAHADPASDLPAVVLALQGRLVARGASGERVIPAGDFFLGPLSTALEPGEILTAVRLPLLAGRVGTAYVKHRHPASGYAVAGVAAVVRLAPDGSVDEARLGVTGVGLAPYRARAAEEALRGRRPEPEVLREAAARATDGVEVTGDLYASEEFRAYLCRHHAAEALEEALAAAA
ncbi:MAG: xanthine dehydrogenase family protein subunit M [Clostridia bacterium]|nr:xanthine dehydrogenase family protein subunit M [Clostridia bacterium]MCL6522377.1 xanthine dehydrogenase family protein subunit M [Bacillota bacterium]